MRRLENTNLIKPLATNLGYTQRRETMTPYDDNLSTGALATPVMQAFT